MLRAFFLSIGQFRDPRVLRLLARSVAVTLLVLGLCMAGGWWLSDGALRWAGLGGGDCAGEGILRGVLAFAAALIGGWLLWRLIALAVLQFFADDVVVAVEQRHYPAAFEAARAPGWRVELSRALRGGLRALIWNLAALPVAIALLPTGIGTPMIFWAVNAVLLGRELTDMVGARHLPAATRRLAAGPLSAAERITLGGIIAGLMFVPIVNLLAPFLGAAMATHLIHRKGHFDAADPASVR